LKKIRQTYHIRAPISRVWLALVDPKVIDAWGGGPARMDARVGTRFALWGGDIHGTNTRVVKQEMLVQDWYGGDWPEPSRVKFTLQAEEHGTKVILVHDGIPDEEVDAIRAGWRDYYLGPMKEYLEAA
jgi:activator of HSP90 ATPase